MAVASANLGVVLAKQGKYDEAVRQYRTALKLDPSLTSLRLNLGLAYYKAGQRDPAVTELRAFRKNNLGHRQATQLLATALLELDRYAESASLFESLLPSDDIAIQLGLATAYARSQRVAESRKIFERVLDRDNSAAAQLAIAHAYLGANDFVQAETYVRQAIATDPKIRGANFLLGAARWKRQDAAEAIEAWRKEAEADPQSFEARFALGAALAESNELPAAVASLQKALQMRPTHAPTLYYLGRIAWKDRRPEALSYLERSVKSDPQNRQARYILAQVYRSTGRTADAQKELDTVRRLGAAQVSREVDILRDSQK